jgi:hypothetical protein
MKVQNADLAAHLPHIEVDKKAGRLRYRRVYPEALGKELVTFSAEKFARDWHQADERALIEKCAAWIEGSRDGWDINPSDFMD